VTDNNDWRVTISLPAQADAEQMQRFLSSHEVEEDVHRRLSRSIAVGMDDSQIFLYAGSESAAREAEQVARGVLAGHGVQAEFALHRWHPIEEAWEAADAAMPRTEDEQQAEYRRLEDEETAESLSTGYAQWEVRVDFVTHHEAVAMADKLRSEGRAVVRRWKFLVVGANNEDEARELAEQIGRDAPPDATVRAEHSGVFLPFIPF
jgi:metal-dependent amidase/aminoacylase/carboxypeptidase family protein